MGANKFTMANIRTGTPSQAFLDAHLNVFGLQLFLESYTKAKGILTEPLTFTYLGVEVQLRIHEKAVCEVCEGKGEVPAPDGFAICKCVKEKNDDSNSRRNA